LFKHQNPDYDTIHQMTRIIRLH